MNIKKHISDINKYGNFEFFRKLNVLIRRFYFFLFITFFSIPLILTLLITNFFVNFRFGVIRSGRIGHLIANTELYLAEKKRDNQLKKKNIDFLCYGSDGFANSFLQEKYSKILITYPNILVEPIYLIVDFLKRKNIFFFKKNIVLRLGAHGDRDLDGLLYKFNNSLNFNKNELSLIEYELQKFGLDFSSKFICLNIRDNAYLKNIYPRGEWNYHNYRNWNINNFIKACESMTRRGYYVLRMGKVVNEKIATNNPMIIDYANSEFKSDILDIYLHSNCFFCATTGTGIDLASYVFRRPIAMMTVPVQTFYTFKNFFHVTKHHKFLDNKKKLTLSEIFEKGLDTLNYLNSNNDVFLEELNQDEINSFLIEVLDILEEKFIWTKKDKDYQVQFRKNYQRLIEKYGYNYLHKNYEAIFSPVFLKNNPQLLK